MSATGRLGRESDDMDVLKESLEKVRLNDGPEYAELCRRIDEDDEDDPLRYRCELGMHVKHLLPQLRLSLWLRQAAEALQPLTRQCCEPRRPATNCHLVALRTWA